MSSLNFHDVIDTIITDRLEHLDTALPARIEKYDAATQKAACKPLVKYVRRDGQGMPLPATALPIINAVPVVFPGSEEFSITFPVNVGDLVLLVFASQGIDEWLFSDGADTDPKTPRRHSINDAIAIPGLRIFSRPFASATLPHLSLGKEGGARIHVKANEVCLGEENPSDWVATAEKLKSALNDVIAALNTHTHLSATPGAPAGPAIPLAPADGEAPPPGVASPILLASQLGSSTVKVKP